MVTDWRGNPLQVGSQVIYPITYGHAVAVREGSVVEIVENPRSHYNWRTGEETVEMDYKFKIQPYRDSRGYYREGHTPKPVWIHVSQNVTAIA